MIDENEKKSYKTRKSHWRTSSGNNRKKSRRGFMGGVFSVIILLLSFICYYYFYQDGLGFPDKNRTTSAVSEEIEGAIELSRSEFDTQIVNHNYYTLGFNHNTMQANWVGYYLSAANLNNPVSSRTEDFRVDEYVNGGSAKLEDYRRSGYDRGHLAPAGDFKFSDEAMSETFYLSNMSPQIHAFNAGIWEKLESVVRKNAKKEGDLYVVTGPIFESSNSHNTIGPSKVVVPDGFYKVILVYNDNCKKAIGFILPHKDDESGNLSKYAMSVDDVEKRTGIDFFYNLPDSDEESLEASFDISKWIMREKQH